MSQAKASKGASPSLAHSNGPQNALGLGSAPHSIEEDAAQAVANDNPDPNATTIAGSAATPSPNRRHFGLHHRARQSSTDDVQRWLRGHRPPRLTSLGSAKMVDETDKGVSSAEARLSASSKRQSSPARRLDGQDQGTRRQSLPGAKPVAPSWHPDAPDGLKVQSPSDAVLLPDLPLAGMASTSKDGVTVQDRVLQSSISAPKLETEKVIRSESVKLQRPGIKVRIITWNQGNSVPKGDLGVLLGRVGEYIAPEAGWDESSDEEEGTASASPATGKEGDQEAAKKQKRHHRGMGVAGQEGIPRKDRIPPLPHDDAHPYHVVVIAGQECPWGDGKRIATGVGLAGELGDLSRSKSRAAQIAKEREREARQKEKEKEDAKAAEAEKAESRTPGVMVTSDEDPFNDVRGVANVPLAPGAATRGRGGRGWSDMCEDWLCRGPLAQATATKGLAMASSVSSNPPSAMNSPEDGSSPFPTRSNTPNMARTEISETGEVVLSPESSFSRLSLPVGDPETPTKRVTLAVPKRVMRTISRQRLDSDAMRKPATGGGSEEKTPEEVGGVPFSSTPPSRPASPIKHTIDANLRQAQDHASAPPGVKKSNHRLAIRIPGHSGTHHVTVQSDGTPLSLGAYELVCKERCYMMYMAVYVWRGCLDRVRGSSQGHVKSGLLAGRVGNKGAVGISLKLGQSRLLFVNAHLAAHEGKVAERIANVEKIKKELKVDTFLPKDDPRNDVDDLTSCFDYAFWFGDLNFRVDITRQHADWLMMKKRYDHALAFDQLKTIMRQQPEVFNGFTEASITFPPTFKYDVLKTIKAKKQEDKLRRQKAADAHADHDRTPDFGDQSVETVEPATPIAAVSSSGHNSNSTTVDRGDDDDDDVSSVSSAIHSSSAGNVSDFDFSSNATSPDTGLPSSPQDNVVASNTAAAEGLGMHGRVIKARKRILNVVHSAVGAMAPGADEGKRGSSERVRTAPSAQAGGISTAMASNSKRGVASQSSSPSPVDSSAVHSPTQLPKPRRHADSAAFQPLTVDTKTLHDEPKVTSSDRRSSIVTFAGTNKSDTEPKAGQDGDDPQDTERQMYDTSAKQRVPSWCDRVLWRSNIPIEADEDDDRRFSEAGTGPRPSRLTTALSNALTRFQGGRHDHHSIPQQQETSKQRTSRDQLAGRSGGGATPLPSAAPQEAPAPSPRRSWFGKRATGGGGPMQRAETMAVEFPPRSDLLDGRRAAKRTLSDTDMPTIRQNGTSDEMSGVREGPNRPQRSPTAKPRRTSFNLDWPRRRKMSLSPLAHEMDDPFTSGRSVVPRHASSDNSQVIDQHNTSVRPPQSLNRPAPQSNASPRRSSRWNELLGHLSPLLTSQGPVANAFANFSFRNSINSMTAHADATSSEEPKPNDSSQADVQLIGPRRGEVDCLLYKSLDDREMRLLEGRSDHRPVIFVGSIGVGRSTPLVPSTVTSSQ